VHSSATVSRRLGPAASPPQKSSETEEETPEAGVEKTSGSDWGDRGTTGGGTETVAAGGLVLVAGRSGPVATAEARMWEHYWHERAAGRVSTGADLDRIAGTHNYGRRVLRRWRASGLVPPPSHSAPMRTLER